MRRAGDLDGKRLKENKKKTLCKALGLFIRGRKEEILKASYGEDPKYKFGEPWICSYCGRKVLPWKNKKGIPSPDWAATRDHVVPVHRRGKRKARNGSKTVLCCRVCNQEKANKHLLMFLLEQKKENDVSQVQ